MIRRVDAWRPLAFRPRRVAIVQAHSEDFVGGCGGLVRYLVGHGSAVTLITLFPSGRDPEEIRIREVEIARTAASLGIHADPPIGPPDEREAVARTLQACLYRGRPDLTLSPFSTPEVERHAEHVLAGGLTLTALARLGRRGGHWRYGNVTCAPEPLTARADRDYLLVREDLARRGELNRLHASQLSRPPNPRWAALAGEDEATDYVKLTDRRSRFQLRALPGSLGLEAAAGVELFQSDSREAA